jgi:hypothetical protein
LPVWYAITIASDHQLQTIRAAIVNPVTSLRANKPGGELVFWLNELRGRLLFLV